MIKRGILLLMICLLPLGVLFVAKKPQRAAQGSMIQEGGNTMQSKDYPMPPLTPEEEAVIVRAGTEAPFSGKYADHYEAGVYICRRCGAELYLSESKFDSECGWPSFDDEIKGAVTRIPDPDGRRTEIVCTNCKAHLGHVFEGEQFTEKNTRHCVNSVSMMFIPAVSATKKATETAIFAGGCFWGVEHAFKQVEGVLHVTSGYTGGITTQPTYGQVSTGTSEHAEAVSVEYDPKRVSYRTLAQLFFEIHDPTQMNRQGPDFGTQYRSAVFYANDEQKKITEELLAHLKRLGVDAVTEVVPAATFYPAEEYHQDYFTKHPEAAQHSCHVRHPIKW